MTSLWGAFPLNPDRKIANAVGWGPVRNARFKIGRQHAIRIGLGKRLRQLAHVRKSCQAWAASLLQCPRLPETRVKILNQTSSRMPSKTKANTMLSNQLNRFAKRGALSGIQSYDRFIRHLKSIPCCRNVSFQHREKPLLPSNLLATFLNRCIFCGPRKSGRCTATQAVVPFLSNAPRILYN